MPSRAKMKQIRGNYKSPSKGKVSPLEPGKKTPKRKRKVAAKKESPAKTTAKTTSKPTGASAVSKSGILARGSSAIAKGASRRGLWGAAGAGLAWAVSEAFRFDPKVAREQLGGGGPKKLSAKQRAVQKMQGKTPPVSVAPTGIVPPIAGVTKPKSTTPRPERVDDYNYTPRKKSTTPITTLGRQRVDAPILKVPRVDLSEAGASTLRANQVNPPKTPTNIKDKFDKDKFDKFRQDSSRADRHLGAPKKKPLGMEDAFWDGASWVR
jgi:hypothetical protein